MGRLAIVPISHAEAQTFVENYHRHLGKVAGCVFRVGCARGNVICGVAFVGRPVSRHLDDGWTLEVNRCCTDGTRNANSMLYGACWRTSRSLGYRRLITYTHLTESGASLRGAGWKIIGQVKGSTWSVPSRPRIQKGQIVDKYRWEITDSDTFGRPRRMIKVPVDAAEPIVEQLHLF